MIHSFFTSVYSSITASLQFIFNDPHFSGLLILVIGYIVVNLIAIIMNDRVNGSKTTLARLVFKEAFWIAVLNSLIWIGENYLCSCNPDDPGFYTTIRQYASYIYMGQMVLFIMLPILAIVANRNRFFKNILGIVTNIISMLHSKKDSGIFCHDDDDNEITSKKSIIILPNNEDKRKGK